MANIARADGLANSLVPGEDRQNLLNFKPSDTLIIVFPKDFFEKVDFEKSQPMTTKA